MKSFGIALWIFFLGLILSNAQESLESILSPLPRPESISDIKLSSEEKKPALISLESSQVCIVDEASFIHQVQLLLKDYYKLNNETIKLTPVQGWRDLSIPESTWNLEILEYPSSKLAPKISLQYRIVGANGTYGPFRILLNCQLWQDAYVAKQSIGTKATLDRSHFSHEPVDVLRQSPGMVDSGIDFPDYELAQSLSSGKVLLWKHLKKKPAVLKGSLVDVVAKEGYMHISMKGEALRDGFVGEFILVRNPNTRRDFKAEVVSENSVRLHF
tara:strand:- start:157 stop:972 length:816 start_codon:yes stop_codon:yes gene_type:complete